MDPNFITDQQWIEYRNLVSLLWLIPLAVFVFASSLLVRLAILPSLWNSREEEVSQRDPGWAALTRLTARARSVWPLSQLALFGAALAALAALVGVFLLAQDWARSIIEETFNRWWI